MKELIHACVIRQITQHIPFGLTALPFGTVLPSVATSYMLGTLCAICTKQYDKKLGELK